MSNNSLDLEYEQFLQEIRERVEGELYVYIILFMIGASSNLYVLSNLVKEPSRTRMNYFIKHLTIADLMVILVTISIEIIWRFLISWPFGHLACKVVQCARVFGFYLTSSILICISLDRYYAFVHPLSILNVQTRNKYFLLASYAISALFCVPQLIVFHVERHPKFVQFAQCSTRGYFRTKFLEQLYAFSSVFCMYLLPLMFIIFCYSMILKNISSSASNTLQGKICSNNSRTVY